MPRRTHKPYPKEFKQKLIALVREGRTGATVAAVRAVGAGDSELGRSGRPRRRATTGRRDDE
jgi:hypothetical protein